MELNEIRPGGEMWERTARIIASRFPTVHVFDRVADAADFDALYAIEALTNPRLREELGRLTLVPPADRLYGPGTTPIMAAFTHINAYGSRFSNGSYGVYYCARNRDTAVAETVYHRERFMRASCEAPMMLEMRAYYADLVRPLHDIRQARSSNPEWYHPDHYGASQMLGGALRASASWGIQYQSVRHAGGECAAVFRPPALTPVTQGEHLGYHWDGTNISRISVLTQI